MKWLWNEWNSRAVINNYDHKVWSKSWRNVLLRLSPSYLKVVPKLFQSCPKVHSAVHSTVHSARNLNAVNHVAGLSLLMATIFLILNPHHQHHLLYQYSTSSFDIDQCLVRYGTKSSKRRKNKKVGRVFVLNHCNWHQKGSGRLPSWHKIRPNHQNRKFQPNYIDGSRRC